MTCSIAFLETLAAAAKSRNRQIRSQIPKKLQTMRILILAPAGLINNWCEEFKKWSKGKSAIGYTWVITSQTDARKRVPLLDEWYEADGGGVLLMGYELFRLWALNPRTDKRAAPFSEAEHKDIAKKLLDGPSLIVADEAHKLKNDSSAITQAAKNLRSKSRIALTGSPLSNNLNEYFSMVDWIAPGYLGKAVEFKANYVEPIEEGLYATSSASERRKARVRLQALAEILEPKIHRKEIDVLKGQLKPKVEFVCKVPLTPLQLDAYRTFISLASTGMSDSVSNARLWGYIAYLQMLCGHPTLFAEAVEKGKNDDATAKAQSTKRPKSPVKRIRQIQDEVGYARLIGVHFTNLIRLARVQMWVVVNKQATTQISPKTPQVRLKTKTGIPWTQSLCRLLMESLTNIMMSFSRC
jgi:SNF2 family DNA or RNA helicase